MGGGLRALADMSAKKVDIFWTVPLWELLIESLKEEILRFCGTYFDFDYFKQSTYYVYFSENTYGHYPIHPLLRPYLTISDINNRWNNIIFWKK